MQTPRKILRSYSTAYNESESRRHPSLRVVSSKLLPWGSKKNKKKLNRMTRKIRNHRRRKLRRRFLFNGKSSIWDDIKGTVAMHCLITTGVYMRIVIPKTASFILLKNIIWEKALNYPQYQDLYHMSYYRFQFINENSQLQQLSDESLLLYDLKPHEGIVKLVKIEQLDRLLRLFDIHIGQLIGKDLRVYDDMQNIEFDCFRRQMRLVCEQIAISRRNSCYKERLSYLYSPRCTLADTFFQVNSIHSPLSYRIRNNHFVIIVKFEDRDPPSLDPVLPPSYHPVPPSLQNTVYPVVKTSSKLKKSNVKVRLKHPFEPEPRKVGVLTRIMEYPTPKEGTGLTTFTFSISIHSTPKSLLQLVLNKRATMLLKKDEHVNQFVLKVLGREEYIFGERRLLDFVYIFECLSRNKTPMLYAFRVSDLPLNFNAPIYNSMSSLQLKRCDAVLVPPKKGKYHISIEIEERFKIYIGKVSNFDPALESIDVGLKVGLYHGTRLLCQAKYTTKRTTKNYSCDFDMQCLQFDIVVGDLPRLTKICFGLYEVLKGDKSSRGRIFKSFNYPGNFVYPLGWANTTVFDFKGDFKTDRRTLCFWPYDNDLPIIDLLQPLRMVVSNPDTKNTVGVNMRFHKYGRYPIMYPNKAAIKRFIELYARLDIQYFNNDYAIQYFLQRMEHLPAVMLRLEVHEQIRKVVWSLRYYIMSNEPHMLPKVLDSVDWNNRLEALEAVSLIRRWPLIPPLIALRLLHYAYPDYSVRKYTIKCLHALNDQDLELYLLQLVQALKQECYTKNDLINFLLHRAFKNLNIGHHLFWLLRSEMSIEPVSVRFGLYLEAYCRGSPEHIKMLAREELALDTLRILSINLRRKVSRDKVRADMLAYLKQRSYYEVFENIFNPLDPYSKLKTLKIDKCRVMDSKMRPLWLVFANADQYGEDINIIFKNGDDLRQDMITLQMIRIMDTIWKLCGMDLRMNAYRCVSTDFQLGMIEVVMNADTIANIQKEKGFCSATSAFRKGSLFEWLKDHNNTESSLSKAVQEFTYSCAGYCVATFILGIADRHSDNIMIKKTGQLFHIDFGHILGHFKEKFGVRRERVPFVLTHDFVFVINKGQHKTEVPEFIAFQELCKNAFMTLRSHGSLILSLFAMMISTGLPELNTESDLIYLRESLVLHLPDVKAEEYFLSKFSEALSNSWKTSLNWASHNVAKNNR